MARQSHYGRGFDDAMSSSLFDPPTGNSEDRDSYRAGFTAGHDKVTAERLAGKRRKRHWPEWSPADHYSAG